MKYEVGPLDSIKEGKISAFEFDKHDVCVVKLNGQIKAFRNMCPHQYVPLEDAVIKGNWIICSMHGWSFDVNSGDCGVNPTCTLPVYKTVIDNDVIFVEIGA